MGGMDESDRIRLAKAEAIYNMLLDFTLEWYGECCEEYVESCPLCKSWKIIDDFVAMNFDEE